MKHLPNFLTSLNLLCGIFALVQTFNQQLKWVAIFILLSLIFDFFDGFSARLLKAQSEFGKQLDSLADMISFGLVPGTVMYFLLRNSYSLPTVYVLQTNTVPILGFLITIFSAFRLANFNISTHFENRFSGLPTPANTIFIVSIALINLQAFHDNNDIITITNQAWFLVLMTFLSCVLLISNISLVTFKFNSLKWKNNKAQLLIIIISFILLFSLKIIAIPIIILAYILISMIYKETF